MDPSSLFLSSCPSYTTAASAGPLCQASGAPSRPAQILDSGVSTQLLFLFPPWRLTILKYASAANTWWGPILNLDELDRTGLLHLGQCQAPSHIRKYWLAAGCKCVS